jgi:hypothetical protein
MNFFSSTYDLGILPPAAYKWFAGNIEQISTIFSTISHLYPYKQGGVAL